MYWIDVNGRSDGMNHIELWRSVNGYIGGAFSSVWCQGLSEGEEECFEEESDANLNTVGVSRTWRSARGHPAASRLATGG